MKIFFTITILTFGSFYTVQAADWGENPFADYGATRDGSRTAGNVRAGFSRQEQGKRDALFEGLPPLQVNSGLAPAYDALNRRQALEREAAKNRRAQSANWAFEDAEREATEANQLMRANAQRAVEKKEQLDGVERRANEIDTRARKHEDTVRKYARTVQGGYTGEAREFTQDCTYCFRIAAACFGKWCCWCHCEGTSYGCCGPDDCCSSERSVN